MFGISHLDKEPTRVACYHGSAVFGIERLDYEGIMGEILPMSGGSLN
jgi:hypothetical protein